jgi:hypothetical protein
MADVARKSLRRKKPELVRALEGRLGGGRQKMDNLAGKK